MTPTVAKVDAPIARLCISNELTLLTADRDFMHAAKHCPLRVWTAHARSKRDA